jgi:hypothetical protein
MEKLFMVIFFCITLSLSAQTTQQEYDYVTKELKGQKVKGLEIKKGYTLEEFLKAEVVEGSWYASYYLLKKEGVKSPIAIVLVSGPSISDARSFFYCIPAFNSDKTIWEQFKISVETFEEGFTYQNALALSKALTSN